MAALCGHWSKNQPIARGKGVFYNDLIEVDYQHFDPSNLNTDLRQVEDIQGVGS